jgi:hypothetical protein
VDRVVALIEKLAAEVIAPYYTRPGRPADLDRFSQGSLIPRMITLIEAMEPAHGALI